MLRALIAGCVVLALSAGAAPARDMGGTPVAFVAVEKASQLVAVDLTTKRVVGRIPVGPGRATSRRPATFATSSLPARLPVP